MQRRILRFDDLHNLRIEAADRARTKASFRQPRARRVLPHDRDDGGGPASPGDLLQWAEPIMQRKLLELGIADPGARPDTIRKAVEYRMAKLNLPTVRRKAPAGRIAKRWTEAQTAALLGALGADATIESVAARTGHSVKSVHAKLARLDYSVHEIAGFAIFTVDQISTLLNVTPRQIRRWKEKGWLQTEGLPHRDRARPWRVLAGTRGRD